MREDISTWVKALRSGKYHQGYDSLDQITPQGQSFCCLGVYREVCLKTFESTPYTMIYANLGDDNCRDFMKVNDSRQVDFNQIADMIEERFSDANANSTA